MSRAAALGAFALVAWSCAIRDPRTSGGQSGQPCSTNDQCNSSVCFLGECRNPSSSLALVHAEVQSGNPRYGTLQSTAIDLRKTPVVDFSLVPLMTVSGRVMQRSDSGTSTTLVPGAVLVFTDVSPAIPDRVVSISAQSDTNPATTGAYTVHLPASIYDVLVAAASSPASHPDGPIVRSEPSLDLVLPAKASLAHVTGTLHINGSPLGGVQVSAVDTTGTSIAVAQVSAADGTFALDLPPGPPAFSLQVGPQAAASANDPVPSFSPQPFLAGQAGNLGIIDLGTLPAPATLKGRVLDARGAPVPSARVMLLSTGAASYLLSGQTTTGADGSFSALIRAGSYLVEAAPATDASQSAVSDPISLQVVAPATPLPSPIVCPDKVTVSGVVVRSDGRPATAGFRVDATRLPDQLVTGRGTRTASTDASGAYSLVLDRGRYRVEITPTTESALPRTILTVDVPSSTAPVALPSLQVSPPHELLGTVRASNPVAVLPGATIDFYAVDSTGRKSVLIGSAISDSSGQYRAILPDVSQFATQ